MRTNLSIAVIVSVLSLGLISCSSSEVSLPDYSAWDKESITVTALYNNERIALEVTAYEYVSQDYSSGAGILVINKDEKPWLLFYEKLVDLSKPPEYYLFEYKDGGWVYVRDFNNAKDLNGETTEFLKTRYNFQFVD